ncbi:MAG: DNA polymerase ligase N-terminal domain-containing protein [Candidatus Altiarchaeota archaeon]
MGLDEYRRKRDAGKTTEPFDDEVEVDRPVYVIQRHQASHLHWDLRLEFEGVLKSWAVPKEPPKDAGVRRLAVQTEDHPLAYASFEGEIPKGEYGGGSVEIWDSGTFQLLEKTEGKIIIDIKGRVLKGPYVLVRTKQAGGRNWLFFKMKP